MKLQRRGALERWREHAWLTAFFLATRLVLLQAGFRFNFELGWMFLCDPSDLRWRAFDCVYYFHAYPPGMNLLSSLLLKVGGVHAATLALLIFWSFGSVLVNALFYLLREFGLSPRWAFAVAGLFSVIPQTLYFEHLYHYEHLAAASLIAACACLHHAIKARSTRAFVVCFVLCAFTGWVRSTFHLVWFVAVLGLALGFAGRRELRRVLVAAVVPFALLFALYLKNAVVFGVFGTTSALAANLTRVTIDQLAPEVRQRWISQHRASPLAGISVFSGPRAYLSFVRAHIDGRSPILDELERPTLGTPNYNHWIMLAIMPTRRQDALAYLRARPTEYASTVMRNVAAFFGPATRWHPRTDTPDSPHFEHAKLLGPYEHAYNELIHSGWGMYVFLPLPCLWAVRRVAQGARSASTRRADSAVLAFALLNIVYVTAVSVVFGFRESARFRHPIEALIWFVTAGASASWLRARQFARHGRR